MHKYTFFFLFLLASGIFPQYVPEWVQIHTINNSSLESPNRTVVDQYGNMYTVNSFNNGSNFDVMTSKYNADGSFAWSRQYGSTGNENIDFAMKIFIDNNNDILIFGNTSTNTYYDYSVFILKYNSGGTLLASILYKRAGSPITIANDMVADNGNNLYLCGKTDNYQTFNDSSIVIKLNQNLSVLWVRTSKDTNVEVNYSRSVLTDPSGSIFVSGISRNNITLKKYDTSGNLLWSRKSYIPNVEYPYQVYPSILIDNNQNIYVSAEKRDITGNDTTQTCLLKYNSSGNIQWNLTFNLFPEGTELVQNIFTDNNDIYMHISDIYSNLLCKINLNGNLQWQKSIAHPVNYINFEQTGKVVAAGYKNGYYRTELSLDRYLTSGDLESSYTYSYNGTGVDQAIKFFNTGNSKLLIGGLHNSSVMMLKLTPSTAQTVTYYRNNINKIILDSLYTYDSINLNVSDLPPFSQVKKVYINIDTVLHTAIGDLRIYLNHEGKTDTLVYQRGFNSDNFIGTKLRDTSNSPICNSNNAPFTGYFKPCYPLSQFQNLSAIGPWVFIIHDRKAPETGILKAWSLIIEYEIPIGITTISGEIPVYYSLSQNYPNPFNPFTKIKFALPSNSFVNLKIYDINGKEIKTLVNEMKSPGIYETEFDGSDLASGVYFYRIETGDYSESRKMVLIK